MSASKGYYSVIQYCPDRSRMEAANVGVMLLCPEIGFVGARTTDGNDRISHFFGRDSFDAQRVNAAKQAIEKRLEVDRESFRTPEDMVRFIDTRGNDILLTSPRPVKVTDPASDLDELFDELVGGRARRQRGQPEIPALDEAFRRPSLKDRVKFNVEVVVPVVELTLKVPYTYRNGVLNLVKPQRFGADEHRATDVAMRLAFNGDRLRLATEDGDERKLIVVAAFDTSADTSNLRTRIDNVLGCYEIRVVHEDQIESFVAEVEQGAH